MSELGYRFSTYDNASFFAPLFFIIVSLPVLALVTLVVYLSVLVIKQEYDRPIWTSVYKALKQVYGDQLEKEEDKGYHLYNWKVPQLILYSLFVSFAIIMICIVVSFWSEFLLAESDQCTDDMDCFAFNNTRSLQPVQNTPLMGNCTKFQESNYVITCYRFVFDYVNAIGNSGSVLVVGSLVMNAQSALAAGAYSIKNKGLRAFLTILLWVYYSLGFLALFVGPLLLLIAPLFLSVVNETRNTKVQFGAYFLTFNVAFQVAGPLYAVCVHRQSVGDRGGMDIDEGSSRTVDVPAVDKGNVDNSNSAVDVNASRQEGIII